MQSQPTLDKMLTEAAGVASKTAVNAFEVLMADMYQKMIICKIAALKSFCYEHSHAFTQLLYKLMISAAIANS
jgi:hypothetical protein